MSYCLRPAVSLKRLRYDADSGRVFYRPIKRRPGDPDVFEWTPLDFLKRLAPIIAPPRLNLARYAGALGPRSKLRPHVTAAARQEIERRELLQGVKVLQSGLVATARKASGKVSTAASRTWAACLKRVFEVNPILCKCEDAMKRIIACGNWGLFVPIVAILTTFAFAENRNPTDVQPVSGGAWTNLFGTGSQTGKNIAVKLPSEVKGVALNNDSEEAKAVASVVRPTLLYIC